MPNIFTYDSYTVDANGHTVHFLYKLEHNGETHSFNETLTFPIALPDTGSIKRALRALHLALGISYYKIFVSPVIAHPYAMGVTEADFWNDVWRGGLGEFLYVNQLSPEKLARFTAQDGLQMPTAEPTDLAGALLGIGGGKDSIVAGELLKTCGIPLEGFVMATGEQLGQTQAVADVMGVSLGVVQRQLDQLLIQLQQQPGAYRGHVPISLIFGLVGTTLALASGKSLVVVANEASASIPRITWEHGEVNHQWSKSFILETALQSYIHSEIAEVTYFSAVRPLGSVAIAKLFAKYKQYLEVFTSDNSVFRIDPAKRPNARWSLESPKSLSSFILMSPWLNEAELLRTFGLNFLDQPTLEILFWELLGVDGEQPLDCVGTVDELRLSLSLTYAKGVCTDTALMRLAVDRGIVTPADHSSELAEALALAAEQAIPSELVPQLLAAMEQQL